MLSRTHFAAALLTLACASAQAELVDIVWSDGGTFTHRTQIASGQFVEVCGALTAGRQVAWSFDASGPTDFNVHYHQGNQVVLPIQMKQVARAEDALRIESDQGYCWMWTNRSVSAISLTARFQR